MCFIEGATDTTPLPYRPLTIANSPDQSETQVITPSFLYTCSKHFMVQDVDEAGGPDWPRRSSKAWRPVSY